MEGVIKWFDPHKGYGFIATSDEERDLFVHKSNVESQNLGEGDLVLYEIRQGSKGPEAFNVRLKN